MTPLTREKQFELSNLKSFVQSNVDNGRSRWHGDKHKVSGLEKMLVFNAFLKGVINEQDNQGLPETTGSGSTGDAEYVGTRTTWP